MMVTVATLFWSFQSFAIDPNENLFERQLDSAEIKADLKQLEIKVGTKVFRVDHQPDLLKMRQALGLELPLEIKEQIVKSGGQLPEDANPLAGYDTLSLSQKAEFQKVRIQFLSYAARTLKSTKMAMGIGSVVSEKLSFIKNRIKGSESQQQRVQLSFNERSEAIVSRLLQNIDYKLWSQAPLVIDANEFGVQASVGILALSGYKDKGFGGGEFFGVSFGYNKETKSFVFEIHHTSERFASTTAAVGIVGLNAFAGMQLVRKNLEQPTASTKGLTFYPPAVPAYSTVGPQVFSAGLSSSIGFPPPPLADLLTWSDHFEKRVLLRVTVSPLMKGFVRLYVGDIGGSVKVMSLRVVEVIKTIAEQLRSLRPVTCHGLFQVN